jgi:LytS/YehU family sensor histidine kinase
MLAALWLAVVVLFAAGWFVYDATHDNREPLRYYFGWSAYIWGVLTPAVLWLAARWPLDAHSWKRSLPRHVLASVLICAVQVSAEAVFGWWRHGHLSLAAALRHYFTQHAEITLLTYWLLTGAVKIRTVYDESRMRALRSSQFEAMLAQVQLQALRTQLQPHFLFNTLQAATTLVYDDPQGAEEILLSLSELLRLSLEAFNAPEVALGRELEFVESYIGIQRRRFGDRLRFDLDIDNQLLGAAVPGLLLQPLVENAIVHGIAKHRGDDVVSVAVRRQGERLLLEVRNSNSRLREKFPEALSNGTGLANTRARLQHLYGIRQSFELRNLESGGVLASISLPLRTIAAPEPVAQEVV